MTVHAKNLARAVIDGVASEAERKELAQLVLHGNALPHANPIPVYGCECSACLALQRIWNAGHGREQDQLEPLTSRWGIAFWDLSCGVFGYSLRWTRAYKDCDSDERRVSSTSVADCVRQAVEWEERNDRSDKEARNG